MFDYYKNLKNKKILLIQNFGTIGGAEINLQRWIEYFREKYNTSFLICGVGVGRFFEEMEKKGIKTIKADMPDWRKGKNFISKYFSRFKMNQLLINEKFDLIFSNDFFYSPYAVYLGKKLNTPVVIHIQSDCEPKRISQYHLDEAEGVIITTQSSYEKLSPYFLEGKLVRVPYGVLPPSQELRSDKTFRKNPESFIFGVAANLLPHKGIDFLFKLANALKGTNGWEIHWVGGDPQGLGESFNSKIKQNNLTDRLFYHGFYKNMDIFYESIDCLIHPAQYEPFGIVLIEAMSHCIPIISTRTKGGVEVLGDIDGGKWIVDLDDWDRMALLMKLFLESKGEALNLGKKNVEKFNKHFLFSQSMEKMESLFSKILMQMER